MDAKLQLHLERLDDILRRTTNSEERDALHEAQRALRALQQTVRRHPLVKHGRGS